MLLEGGGQLGLLPNALCAPTMMLDSQLSTEEPHLTLTALTRAVTHPTTHPTQERCGPAVGQCSRNRAEPLWSQNPAQEDVPPAYLANKQCTSNYLSKPASSKGCRAEMFLWIRLASR